MDTAAKRLPFYILAGTIPAAIVGKALEAPIEEIFRKSPAFFCREWAAGHYLLHQLKSEHHFSSPSGNSLPHNLLMRHLTMEIKVNIACDDRLNQGKAVDSHKGTKNKKNRCLAELKPFGKLVFL